MPLKESPLIEEQLKLKPRFISFHGFKLPLEYSLAKLEHLCVRQKAGLFDVSQMGEIRITGPRALTLLERLLTSNAADLKNNQAQYSLLLNEQGGIIDDLIVYCLDFEKDYLLCVNAGCIDKDFEWIKTQNSFSDVEIKNESTEWAQLALQGPESSSILPSALGLKNFKSLKKFHFIKTQGLIISATGYTGEKGFEILVKAKEAKALWRNILKAGKSFGLKPAGLAARDTLRMEMKYPLYGQDLTEDINPYSAGLIFSVKNKKKFIGSPALEAGKKNIQNKWVGFKILSRGIPRKDCLIFQSSNNKTSQTHKIGWATSGAFSPSLNHIIGLGFVNKDYSSLGQKIFVQIHGELTPAQIVATPFIKK